MTNSEIISLLVEAVKERTLSRDAFALYGFLRWDSTRRFIFRGTLEGIAQTYGYKNKRVVSGLLQELSRMGAIKKVSPNGKKVSSWIIGPLETRPKTKEKQEAEVLGTEILSNSKKKKSPQDLPF